MPPYCYQPLLTRGSSLVIPPCPQALVTISVVVSSDLFKTTQLPWGPCCRLIIKLFLMAPSFALAGNNPIFRPLWMIDHHYKILIPFYYKLLPVLLCLRISYFISGALFKLLLVNLPAGNCIYVLECQNVHILSKGTSSIYLRCC